MIAILFNYMYIYLFLAKFYLFPQVVMIYPSLYTLFVISIGWSAINWYRYTLLSVNTPHLISTNFFVILKLLFAFYIWQFHFFNLIFEIRNIKWNYIFVVYQCMNRKKATLFLFILNKLTKNPDYWLINFMTLCLYRQVIVKCVTFYFTGQHEGHTTPHRWQSHRGCRI